MPTETPPSIGYNSVTLDYFNAILHALLPELDTDELAPSIGDNGRQIDYLHAIWQATLAQQGVLSNKVDRWEAWDADLEITGTTYAYSDVFIGNDLFLSNGDFLADGSARFADGNFYVDSDGTLHGVDWYINPDGSSSYLNGSFYLDSGGTLHGVDWYISPDGSNNLLGGGGSLVGITNTDGDLMQNAEFWGIYNNGYAFFGELHNYSNTFAIYNNGYGYFANGAILFDNLGDYDIIQLQGVDNGVTIGSNGTIASNNWMIDSDGSTSAKDLNLYDIDNLWYNTIHTLGNTFYFGKEDDTNIACINASFISFGLDGGGKAVVTNYNLTGQRAFDLPDYDGDIVVKNADGTSQDRPYKVYTALLTQTDTNAPVATVLENTLGEITFSRDDVGFYKINSSGLFLTGKTHVLYNGAHYGADVGYQSRVCRYDETDTNVLNIASDNGGNNADNLLRNQSIEIRVYN